VKGYSESGRDVYVEDGAYKAIWTAGDAALRDAMDLAYLTGQRPSDVLRMSETDIRERIVDGVTVLELQVRQAKTGTPLRITIEGELAQVVARIRERKRGHRVYNTRLIVNDRGSAVTLQLLQRRFVAARTAAGVTGVQFRDLRAKAGTDKADASGDARAAQRQLGHSSVVTTERYLRDRLGAKVTPTK